MDFFFFALDLDFRFIQIHSDKVHKHFAPCVSHLLAWFRGPEALKMSAF